MGKLVKFTKRYEVYSIILGLRFLEGTSDSLRKAQKLARNAAKTHGKVELIDTEENGNE